MAISAESASNWTRCVTTRTRKTACAEERLAPEASAARAEVAQEGQASPARVEVAQESLDEEMTDACVTSDLENVKPRIEEYREDSKAVSSRMEDTLRIEVSREHSTNVISRIDEGNTPVGRQLASAEVTSWSGGVLLSRKRGSEERGTLELENPMLERTDGTEMCISVMTVIHKSMGGFSEW